VSDKLKSAEQALSQLDDKVERIRQVTLPCSILCLIGVAFLEYLLLAMVNSVIMF